MIDSLVFANYLTALAACAVVTVLYAPTTARLWRVVCATRAAGERERLLRRLLLTAAVWLSFLLFTVDGAIVVYMRLFYWPRFITSVDAAMPAFWVIRAGVTKVALMLCAAVAMEAFARNKYNTSVFVPWLGLCAAFWGLAVLLDWNWR